MLGVRDIENTERNDENWGTFQGQGGNQERTYVQELGHQPSHKFLYYSLSCMKSTLGLEASKLSLKRLERLHSVTEGNRFCPTPNIRKCLTSPAESRRKDQRNHRGLGHYRNMAHRVN